MNVLNTSLRITRWVLLFVVIAAGAADKSGVSPNSISLPKGPGSIEGLGESFQPTLNTGTAKHGIDLQLPRGTAGHQPALSLVYDGGGANGPVGYGWNLSQPLVQRRTDQGIPTYGESLGVERSDVFINEQREELVPGSDGFFRCANEATFVRYRPVADHWEATAPNGTRLEFGISSAGRIADGTTGKVFTWLLERETDTRGNVIEYQYRAFAGEANVNQKYLAAIRYGPGAPPWTHYHFATLEYEDRPDWFEDGRAGFLVRTGKRLKAVIVGTQGVKLDGHLAGDFDGDGIEDYLNRRYDLEYLRYAGDASHWSLLSRVTLLGADGVTSLPPAVFDYAVSNPPEELSALGQIWGGVDEPFAVMDSDLVDLVDLNGDGLPDVLKTESGGGVHTVWINRGPVRQGEEWAVAWSAPEAVDPGLGTAWNFDLASERTHLADMDGDGLSDLVHRSGDDTVFYFANRGRLAWSERRDMSVEEAAPPAPFGNANVRTADVDFDKRMDIIQSVDVSGGIGYRVWFNLGSQAYSPSVLVESEGGFDLALAGVQIADCNGDRVPDVARIQSGAVQVAAGLGYGRFAPARAMVLPDVTLDELQIANAKLTDINGDGLADLVLERGAPGECWYWLNLGNYTLSERKRIVDLPVASAAAAVRWADLNGNGTTDLVYADGQSTPRIQLVELGELVSGGLAPNLLRRIENGIGRVTEIEYAPSTRFALEDAAAGKAWPDPLPFPVTVVSGVRVSDSLGHEYETRFRYHDGYYDPVEKQFRGFGRVEQIDVGDPTAPTLVSRSEFDTGRSFDAMKGRLLRLTAETADGGVFSSETTLWADPPRLLLVGTNGAAVRYAHPVGSYQEIVELGLGTPRRIESEFEFDDYGNRTRVVDYGVVEGADRTAWGDERIAVTEYALNLEAWIIRLPMHRRIEDLAGLVISRSELFYDDEAFSGDHPGNVPIGNLTMQRDWIDPGDPLAYVTSTRTRYDQYGNPVGLFDPLWVEDGGVAQGHSRELAYDAGFHSYPVRETIQVGGGKPPLVFAAVYDEGLATVRNSSDFNGNTTRYDYDALGRLVGLVKPGDSTEFPTAEYEYGLAVATATGGLVNYVETRQLDREPGTAGEKTEHYLIARQFVDGLGRSLMTRSEAEPAEGSAEPRVVVSGAVLFNARRQPVRGFNPFFTVRSGALQELLAFEDLEAPGWQGLFHENGGLRALDLATAHQSLTEYDATLRANRSTHADGTFSRTGFEPLVTRWFDENDVDPVSVHFDTPRVQFSDGLGRLIRVDEVVRLNDDGTTSASLNAWTTRYEYDLNDQLTRIVDSQENVKLLRYDGLKRKIFMNDPDAGVSTYDYDAGSNLIGTMDAKGQRITYTYDGANRILTEDYHDEESTEHSYQRSPDLRYHYDEPAEAIDQGDGRRATARNTRGQLAWVEDTSGEEHTSFDERGRLEWTLKRIPDPVLSTTLDPASAILVAYKTGFEYDAMDRVTRLIYPDHDEVTYRYNGRGLLEGITGGPSGQILSGIGYLPSAQQHQIDYGNGVRTTYGYDERLRLQNLLTVTQPSTRNQPLVHFRYELDPVSNIRAIHDDRPAGTVPLDDPRRNNQAFAYDSLYRLTGVEYNAPNPATANGGQIGYRYDRIGNLIEQTSDIVQVEQGLSMTDLGRMDYGGASGRFGRMGRATGEPPGPHALSEISNQQSAIRNYRYDGNGNVTEIDGLRCTWDFRDRLVAVEDNVMRAEYRYDYTGQRMIKRVVVKQIEPGPVATDTDLPRKSADSSTLYPNRHFEVREHDQPTKYVFNGSTRVAAIRGSLSASTRLQRIRLFTGWNLLALAVSAANGLEQLSGGARGGEGVVQSVYMWDPATGEYTLLTAGQTVPAGTVLWIKSDGEVVVGIIGAYVEPTSPTVPAGGAYLAGAGLEAWSPRLPATLSAWTWAGQPGLTAPAGGRWSIRLAGDLLEGMEPPATLGPGQALFVRTGVPVPLEIPDAALRIRFYHQDHLGSSSAITDADGGLVEESVFHPFGIPRHVLVLREVKAPYQFTQMERDDESRLYYFTARYLASQLARFISADPKYVHPDLLGPDDYALFLSNPQELNLYAYVHNNPLREIDPTGLGGAGDFLMMPRNAAEHRRMSEAVKSGPGFFNLVQLGLGAVACATGNPVGCVAAAHAVDQIQAEVRGSRPVTAQTITAITGSQRAGDWGNFGIGIALSLGSGPRLPGSAPMAAATSGAPPVVANSVALARTANAGPAALARTANGGSAALAATAPAAGGAAGTATVASQSGAVCRAMSAHQVGAAATREAYFKIFRQQQSTYRAAQTIMLNEGAAVNWAFQGADEVWAATRGTRPPGK